MVNVKTTSPRLIGEKEPSSPTINISSLLLVNKTSVNVDVFKKLT